MTLAEEIITISLCTVATIATRAIPFIAFSGKRKTPRIIEYLGKVLPTAIFAMLVIYCLKNVEFITSPSHGLPELIAIAGTISVHLWKRKMIISIAVGTILYMVLIRIM